MPFSAQLSVPFRGSSITLLEACAGLRTAMSRAVEWEGALLVDVLPLLLVQDVYGDEYEFTSDDVALWRSAENVSVLSAQDLCLPEIESYVGKWNVPFIQWLKAISAEANEELSVKYDHERGDTPYEYVWWRHDPRSIDRETEVFGVASHGGLDECEWQKEVARFADGRIEFRASGEYGDAPRYL